ncbi:hypothetical protein Mapa_008893 [Marchantia paleacea]|nr:hypothetical protein Mapa_008893 [Marchantia paleacea]
MEAPAVSMCILVILSFTSTSLAQRTPRYLLNVNNDQALQVNTGNQGDIFKNWMKEHSRVYKDEAEERLRFDVLKPCVDFVI